jgi:hypothetical protein
MKKKLIVFVFVAALIAIAAVSYTKAMDPNMPDANKPKDPNAPKAPMSMTLADEPNTPAQKEGMLTIKGMLMVTKDAAGAVTAVKLENRRRGTFNIVLDAKGKELAEKMADKFVEVTGKETTKDNEKWLTVEKYTEATMGEHGRHGPNEPAAPGGGKKGGY